MKNKDLRNWGLLILRIAVATVFLYHGIPKAIFWSMASEKFVGMGFFGFLGPIVGIVEVVAAVLILIGIWHKWANYALAVVIAVALVGVQIPKSVSASSEAAKFVLTAGFERDLLILASNLLLAWFGPGKFRLGK